MLGKAAARRLRAAFAAAAALACVLAALALPVLARDTDLWYHLNAGRFMAAARGLPAASFFSFLSPPRPAADYYWLFQVLVHALFALGGYPALLVLRAAALAATLWLCALLLGLEDGREFPAPSTAVLLALYAFFLLPRGLLVRPHMFSYLFICAALWALERGGKRLYALPLLGALWGNVHGVEYPVVVLIGSAYALEALLSRKRGEGRDAKLAFSALLAASVFLTPLGARLVDLPFLDMPYFRMVVSEGARVRLDQLLGFSLSAGLPTWETLFNVLLALALACAAGSVWRKEARPARLILLAGGLFLLTKAARLRVECALLCLPLLASRPRPRALPAWAGALAALLAAALPAAAGWRDLSRRPAWPLSRWNLPVGVAGYLQRLGGEGRVWNDPDSGGYLEWALGPTFKIAADMQTPFLFSDDDFLETRESFENPALLAGALKAYSPEFIAAPLRAAKFPSVVAKHPDYKLVFYDDAAALYADRKTRPRLTADPPVFGDPFDRQELALPEPSGHPRAARLPPALARMLELDGGCLKTRWRAARLSAAAGDYDQLREHAAAIERAYPESPFGWFADGFALARTSRPEDARAALRRALKLAPEAVRPAVLAELQRLP